jgi:hypothetical protein
MDDRNQMPRPKLFVARRSAPIHSPSDLLPKAQLRRSSLILLHFFKHKSNSEGVKSKYQGSTERVVGVTRLQPLVGRIFLIPELLTTERGNDGGGSSSRQQVRRDSLFRITRIGIREPRYFTEERKLGACKSNIYKEEKENGIQ